MCSFINIIRQPFTASVWDLQRKKTSRTHRRVGFCQVMRELGFFKSIHTVLIGGHGYTTHVITFIIFPASPVLVGAEAMSIVNHALHPVGSFPNSGHETAEPIKTLIFLPLLLFLCFSPNSPLTNSKMASVTYEVCPTSAPFFGFMGVTAAIVFASEFMYNI